MGICFPEIILGDGGLLTYHQNHIERLSIFKESGCHAVYPPLKSFQNLRHLTWKGLLNDVECQAVRDFLALRHERVESLDLDFIDWSKVAEHYAFPDSEEVEIDDPWAPIEQLIFDNRGGKGIKPLSNLENLSLSAISLRGSQNGLVNILNLLRLRNLRLLNCPYATEMLEHVASTGLKLQVSRAELSISLPERKSDIIDFLTPFRDLEDLFLMLESDAADEYYIRTITHHLGTLRRFVFHRRHFCLHAESPYYKEYCDVPLGETATSLVDVLLSTRLECAGICAEPWRLKQMLHKAAPRMGSLRLLHLRYTGKELRRPKFFDEGWSLDQSRINPRKELDRPEFQECWGSMQGRDWCEDELEELESFVEWAFSPTGFPHLQVLASGDFSYGNRFVNTHQLFCRDRSRWALRRWRWVEATDIAEQELIDANMDFLASCPVSPLFYNAGQADVYPGMS